ncbi:MAG: hypothetical protein KF810_02975 [Rhizobiaceae bacterium]|nr:hypothetical protein [Rhizobiaceae bacterium]
MTAIYKIGTATVTNGLVTVTGTDTAWVTALVTGGLFTMNGLSVPIESVGDEDELTLALPWPGSGGTGVYAIVRDSSTAALIVSLNDRLAQIIARMVAMGIPPSKIGTLAERDALTLGVEDDQFIFLRFEVLASVLYVGFYRWTGTEWIGPFDPKGDGGDPGTPGTGDRFDVAVFAQGKPAAGELLLRHVFSDTGVTFPADLSASRASGRDAATAEAVVSLEKNGSEFGTVTFAAAGDTGTFAAATPTGFAAGDILTVIAPSPRDATLADVSITLAGVRT